MIGHAKTVLALLAAALAGYVVGVYTVATNIPTLNIIGDGPPPWVATAEWQYTIAAVGALVCAFAWMYVDYRYIA